MSEIVLSDEMADIIEAMVTETEMDSTSQPVAAEFVGNGRHHNTAQRDFMAQQAYRLAVAVRQDRIAKGSVR